MGIKINFKVKGSGKPLIILHGLFGMLDNWNSIGNKLSADYKVYLVDQRDHGRSDKSKEFDYELVAEDLKNFCDDHGLEKIGIIGHSMGGKSAMTFTDRYPSLVSKLMVVDIAPKAYVGGHEYIFEAILSVPIDTITKRSEVDNVLARSIRSLGVRQFLMKNLSRKREGGFEWKANFRLLYDHYHEISAMPQLSQGNDIDAMFLKGEKSNYILPEDHDLIESLYPNATIETIDDAGHWLHAEQPDELIAKVYAFFQ